MAVYMPTAGFDLISRATACVKSDPQTAQHHLDAIKKGVPILLEKLKLQEQQLEDERDEIEREEASLMRMIGNKEREMNKLRSDKKAIETNKARYEAALDDAGRDLRSAQSKKRKAESDKSSATAGAVGGGVGAAFLGILFPPSLLVTVPTVVTASVNAIKEADKEISRANDRTSDARSDIRRENRRISEANQEIYDIEEQISTMSDRRDDLHDEVGKKRKTIVFLQRAVTFFGKLQVAVKSGGSETQMLYEIVDIANKEEQYEIMGSDGYITVVDSFGAAWKKIEEQVLKGKKAGFMSISYRGRAHLQN